jgi:peptidoglycan DL-endopeptidase CwlO
VKRLPVAGLAASERSIQFRQVLRLPSAWRRTALAGAVAVLATAVAPAAASYAASSRPVQPQPSLSSLVAQAKGLARQIEDLSNNYDGLQIQLTEARAEAKTAQITFRQDAARLAGGQAAIGQLAAESYMNGGMASPLQVLTSPDTGTMLSRVSIMQQLQNENGDRVAALSTAEAAAQRAHDTALQQAKRVSVLAAQMAKEKQVIQGKVNTLNSKAFAKAMSIFQQTGNYPSVSLPTANTVGEQALEAALTRRGDPYVWGAAGPDSFDCSGLVKWAYAQVGINLPHYTVSQWNMGEHISKSQLEPGDLVFFFPTIEHVGIYVGDGLMLDAPQTGQVVQIQPIFWDEYVGAVRIIA